MRRLTTLDLKPDGRRLLPDLLGEARITGGGVYLFKPGETAHPEPRHVHNVDEVFIFLQGAGVIPVDGTDHPVQAGDVVVVAAGEDHHTRSSVDDPPSDDGPAVVIRRPLCQTADMSRERRRTT